MAPSMRRAGDQVMLDGAQHALPTDGHTTGVTVSTSRDARRTSNSSATPKRPGRHRISMTFSSPSGEGDRYLQVPGHHMGEGPGLQ